MAKEYPDIMGSYVLPLLLLSFNPMNPQVVFLRSLQKIICYHLESRRLEVVHDFSGQGDPLDHIL